MSWIITYAASSVAIMLLIIVIEPRLRPEWREAMLWLSLISPILVATIAALAPAQSRSRGFASIAPAIAVPLTTTIQVTPRSTLDVGLVAVVLWGSIALLIMVRDVVIHRRLIRALDRKVVSSRNLLAIASRLGLHRHVVLTESRTLPVPIAIGSAEICLPSSLLQTASQDELEPIMAHELAHLRRRDPRLQQAARFISLVLWWQPLNRVVARKLAAVAELRADALSSTVVAPTRLASTLVEFAHRMQMPPVAGMPAFPSGLLKERVSYLLSERRSSSSKGIRFIVCLILILAALSVTPRFALLGAQLPPMLEPLIVKASLLSPNSAGVIIPPNATDVGKPHAIGPTRTSPPGGTTIEPRDDDVIAALTALLNDPEKHVRSAARESLRRIGTPASVNALAGDRFAETDIMKEIR